MYRPPNGDMTVLEKFCENLLSANNKTSKNIIFAGDLHINVLDYESNIFKNCNVLICRAMSQTY